MRQEEITLLPDVLKKYLKYLEAALNKSNLTVLEYGSDLRLFFRFLMRKRNAAPTDVEFDKIDISGITNDFIFSVTLDDAYDFLIYCKNERKNDAASRARKAVSLKRFYNYLETHGYIEHSNLTSLEMPKKKKSVSKFLTLEQSRALLNAPDGKNKERDVCILTIFLNCGLRLAELVSLNIGDISFDNKSLRILGKGNKERIVYINNACVEAIKAYLAVRPKEFVKDPDALFLSNRLSRLSRESVQKMVEGYLKKIGLGNEGLSVHKLRHTAATLMYQYSDTDVLELKKLLGHESLSTTEIYTHLNDDKVREAVENNPLNE